MTVLACHNLRQVSSADKDKRDQLPEVNGDPRLHSWPFCLWKKGDKSSPLGTSTSAGKVERIQKRAES